MTPAEELREAARLMRERAGEAETDGYGSDHPGKPWCPAWTYSVVRHVERNMDLECPEHGWGTEREGNCNTWGRYAGYHIAGMHPGVALAVADWLEVKAANLDVAAAGGPRDHDCGYAVAVARAYLAPEIAAKESGR